MTTPSPSEAIDRLLGIIEKLRDPQGGCPWDRKQTHESLGPLLVEECYEAISAVDDGPEHLSEELGDILSLLLLHAQIAREKNEFDFATIATKISDKLVRRHPHVFGTHQVDSVSDVMATWEAVKKEEKRSAEKPARLLNDVPKGMPALLRAQRIGDKCATVGFEWKTVADVRAQVLEEVRELMDEFERGTAAESEQAEEFGDLFFALVQLARRMHFNAEELLQRANAKFVGRFEKMEDLAQKQRGERGLEGLTLEGMDLLWQEVKRRG